MSLKSFFFSEVVPLAARDSDLSPPAIFQPYHDAIDRIAAGAVTADDPRLLDLSLKVFDNDASRRASIDSRAGGMMSAIALAATLVTGVAFNTFKDAGAFPISAFWTIFLSFTMTLAYLTATVVLLFQIQGRMFRSTLDPTDLDPAGPQPGAYPRHVATKVLRYAVSNFKVNNLVVGRLWAAQKCFRNGLLVLVLGGLLTTVILIPSDTRAEQGLRLAQALARAAGCSDLPALRVDRNGRWRGTCLFGKTAVSVVVDANGVTSFHP